MKAFARFLPRNKAEERAQQDASATTTRTAWGKGSGWTSAESISACKAFVRASEDPARGNGRKREEFEALVHDKFKQIVADTSEGASGRASSVERSAVAVCARFKKLRKACIKFEGIVKSLKLSKPTGSVTEADFTHAATAIFNEVGTVRQLYDFIDRGSGRKDCGQSFPFATELNYLRTTQLWAKILESGTKLNTSSRLPSPANTARLEFAERHGDDSEEILNTTDARESGPRSAPGGTVAGINFDNHVHPPAGMQEISVLWQQPTN
eukprot:IDg5211t1